MSEYTHNDDVADLLHETQATWLEEREQMIARLGEVYNSWLASNAELNDAKAEIANLASELKVKEELIKYLVKYYLDIGARRDTEIANLTGLLASTQTKLDRLETELDRLEREHARGL